jgi:hypothetical protein
MESICFNIRIIGAQADFEIDQMVPKIIKHAFQSLNLKDSSIYAELQLTGMTDFGQTYLT